MKTVSSSYAREHLPELLKAVSQGERIVIQLHKRAIAELGPPSAPQRPVPKLGTGKGKGKIIDPRWAAPLTDEKMEAFIDGRYGTQPSVMIPILTLRPEIDGRSEQGN